MAFNFEIEPKKMIIEELVEGYMMTDRVAQVINKYLISEYQFDCASRAKDSKPEIIFQRELKQHIESKGFEVEIPYTIKTNEERKVS